MWLICFPPVMKCSFTNDWWHARRPVMQNSSNKEEKIKIWQVFKNDSSELGVLSNSKLQFKLEDSSVKNSHVILFQRGWTQILDRLNLKNIEKIPQKLFKWWISVGMHQSHFSKLAVNDWVTHVLRISCKFRCSYRRAQPKRIQLTEIKNKSFPQIKS